MDSNWPRISHARKLVSWWWLVIGAAWSLLERADSLVGKYASVSFQERWASWWHFPIGGLKVWLLGVCVITTGLIFEGSYRLLRGEKSTYENALVNERARNALPQITTEVRATFFDFPLEPHGRSGPTLVVYVFLRLTVTQGPDTTLTSSSLSLKYGGISYKQAGETGWEPVYLRHSTSFRSGFDESRGGDTVSQQQQISGAIRSLQPLKRGIHTDVIIVFRVANVEPEITDNHNFLRATDFRVSVVDAFNQTHSSTIMPTVNIPIGGPTQP